MQDETKNLWDVLLQIITLLGAALAFVVASFQWRRSQDWQRADRLDKLVEKSESDELLRLAAAVADWTSREIQFRGQAFQVENREVLHALRFHGDIQTAPKYPGNQATLRDAYDALLSFFARLELAISTGLVDASAARLYFAYWLEHFLTFKRHLDVEHVLGGQPPRAAVAKYIRNYGDRASVVRLCQHFGLTAEGLDLADSPSPADAASGASAIVGTIPSTGPEVRNMNAPSSTKPTP